MNPEQLRDYIIKPALQALGHAYATDSAITLLLATAAQESACGRYVHQVDGPALGYLQMEPATLLDLYANAIEVGQLEVIGLRDSERLIYDWRYATQCARLQYARYPEALPEPSDVIGMWDTYKRIWNSKLGRADKPAFRRAWEMFVEPTLK